MKTTAIFIGSEICETNKKLEVKNPFNGEVVGITYLAGKEEIEKAIEKGNKTKSLLKTTPSYKRYEWLMDIAAKLKDQKNRMAETIALESGKPMKYALGEVDRSIQTFTVAAEESKRLPKEYISLDWTKPGENKEGLVKYFPIGLVAGITPFNFPLNLAVHKIAPAIAAGCPIVIKPASATPLSCLLLAKIIYGVGLPDGSISVLPCDRATGNSLVKDERFNLLSFTGSPEVGWKMKAEAGKKKVVLELGGNAGVIVAKSANLSLAIEKCVAGAFSYSGQVCIHTQRIFVQSSLFDTFINEFITKTKNLQFGDPLSEKTDVSVMIDEKNAIRVENWVQEAIEAGAKILYGGKRNDTFFEPTIITNTKNSMKVVCEEIFGPVVIIEKFDDFETAVEEVNNSKFGLQAGVFSNNLEEVNYAFENIECGGICINDVPTFRVDHMPYGGVKDSGIGREGVKYAILDMMEPRILVKPIL